jgi:transposase-like protein
MARRWANRAAYWRGVLADWKSSGLTASEFSRRRKICRPLLFVWRRRLGTTPTSKSPRRPPFLPVRIVAPPPASASRLPVELTLRNGRLLRVPADFPPKALADLAAALEATSAC